MKQLLIGLIALGSISAFAGEAVLISENLYSDLKISLDKVGAATQEMTLKSDFRYSLGLSGYQFKDAFNDYKQTVSDNILKEIV